MSSRLPGPKGPGRAIMPGCPRPPGGPRTPGDCCNWRWARSGCWTPSCRLRRSCSPGRSAGCWPTRPRVIPPWWPTRSPGTPAWSRSRDGQQRPVRVRAVAARAGHCLAPDGPRRARCVDRLVAGGLVARRGPGRRAHPGREPGDRRTRRSDHLRTARGAAVAAGPSRRPAPFAAARAIGAPAARGLWLLLWASLAYFAVQPANRAPQAMSGMISAMAGGEPELAPLGRARCRRAAGRAGTARVGAAGRRPRGGRRRRVPTALRGPRHAAVGGAAGRGDLGGGAGARRHPHRHGHRPWHRPAADAAGRGLLARRSHPAQRSR